MPHAAPLRIAFRVDASIEIGTGHVMRCLTLAGALAEHGVECVFLCRPLDGHLLDFIAGKGFHTLRLPALTGANAATEGAGPPHAAWLGTGWAEDARDSLAALADHTGGAAVDWMVVDHYALDARWEKALRPACERLMVIDDLADRPHECDLLLDQSLGREAEDYAGLIPLGAATLLGPRYALLRPEFARLREASLARRKRPVLRRLLVTMGGVDKDNATGRVLDALTGCTLPDDVEITVVMGPHAPWLDQVREQAAAMRLPTEVLVGVSDMAGLMAESDLAIGAGGTTTWERCSLGLPSIIMVLADNQKSVVDALQKAGAAIALRRAEELVVVFPKVISPIAMAEPLGGLSQAAAKITDGQGSANARKALLGYHD